MKPKSTMNALLTRCLIMSAALFVISCDSDKNAPPQEIAKEPAPAVTIQEISLVTGCNACHGADGVSSNPDTPFIAGQPAKYLELAMHNYLVTDRKHDLMRQAVFDLDTTERKELANYYASLTTQWRGGSESRQTDVQHSGTVTVTQAAILAGQALSKPCAGCHGIDGNSVKAGVPSLAGLQPVYFVPAVKSYLSGARQGAAIMKNFKLSLNKTDINNLAAFYSVQERQRSPLSEATRKITPSNALTQRCLGCHGDDGNSTHPAIPSLAGQNATYLIKAMKTYRDNKRANKMMSNVAMGLSDDDIESNAAYFATRIPVHTRQTNSAATSPVFDPVGDGSKLAASCNGCHGDKGNIPIEGTPRLAGLSTDYIKNAITSYRDGKRTHAMMQMLAKFLNETDIEKISLYYANQTPKNTRQKSTGTKAGQELASACSGCHGNEGNSQDPKIPSLAGQGPTYLVNAINSYKEKGSRQHADMKGVAQDLSKKAASDLARYYSEQVPTSVQPRALEGPEVLSKKCDRCHGENGAESNPDKPRIAGQRQSYLRSALMAYKKGDRANELMQAMSGELWTVEIEAIAAYYAGR